MKKQFLILFAFISVLAFGQVPQRFNKVIVTGDITSPKFIKTGSNADSVLLGNGSARSVNSIKTDTVSLSNRINAKAAGNGTANGTNTGDETLTSIKTKLGAATSVSDGYLKYQDYVKFDGKLSSEVDGSTTNELQTISTTGAAGNITLSNSGGTLNLNVNDADASATNEIQDLSLSGNTLTLSLDATAVDISQSTAVLANTAKVSNANHTGDATGSTALTLATVNSNVGTYNNVTINAKGLATAGSNVGYLTGITSGQVTTALGYTPYNSTNPSGYINGINSGMVASALGYTPLPTRTFGTAANSAVVDFIQNQNRSAQSALMWISGSAKIDGGLALLNRYDNSSNGSIIFNSGSGADFIFSESAPNIYTFGSGGYGSIVTPTLSLNIYTRAATFASTVNSTGFLLNGNNLTSSLTTNYIPKWNGSSFVNSLVSDDGTTTTLHSTTASTSPTTGALVTPGGIGVGGGIYSSNNIITDANVNGDVANFNEFVKSGGTSSQFLKANGSVDATNYQPAITLTTNGTSGAATFSGGVLNVPNYVQGASSGIIPVTVISSSNSYTITNSDCWITYTYNGYPSITLPSTRIVGKIFYFRSASTYSGTIYGNGANILSGTSSSPSASSGLGARFTFMILWDGINWQMSSVSN